METDEPEVPFASVKVEDSANSLIVKASPRYDDEQQLFDPESKSRKEYEPYKFGEKERRDLGREKERFEEWENLSFKEFATREEFKSPEAVVSYFLDHPDANIQDGLVELMLDDKYQTFLNEHFAGKTKLNPKALASEISDIVGELIILREKLHGKVEEINDLGSQAIESHLGYEPPKIDSKRLLLVPSVDVYNYIAHGVSTNKLKEANMGSNGTASYPVIPDNTPEGRTIRRVAMVPMAYGIKVETTKLELESKNKMAASEVDAGKNWYSLAINTASHESEHARVWGKIDHSSGEIRLGFKSLPRRGNLSEKQMEQRREEKGHDEGMTDFISIWKQKVTDGTLSTNATFDQVVDQVGQSIFQGAYYPNISEVIADMKQFKDELGEDDPLQYFLSNYYNSSAYPSSGLR